MAVLIHFQVNPCYHTGDNWHCQVELLNLRYGRKKPPADQYRGGRTRWKWNAADGVFLQLVNIVALRLQSICRSVLKGFGEQCVWVSIWCPKDTSNIFKPRVLDWYTLILYTVYRRFSYPYCFWLMSWCGLRQLKHRRFTWWLSVWLLVMMSTCRRWKGYW